MPFGNGSILAPVDIGSNPEAALDWVAAVALLLGRDIDIYFAAPHRKDEPLLREELQALAAYTASKVASKPGIKVRHSFEPRWDPVAGIVETALEKGHSLIVQITRERSALQRLIQGSTTDDVLAQSPCPMLAVPDDLPVPNGPLFKRILAATDLGDTAPMALASEWARQGRASLTYLYVVDSAHAHLPELAIATDPEASFDEVVAGSRRAINAYIHEHPEIKPDGPYEVEVTVGDSAREITRQVQQAGYDLVIAGHHQRGLLAKIFMGSVAEEVLHRADVPMLIVPQQPTNDDI